MKGQFERRFGRVGEGMRGEERKEVRGKKRRGERKRREEIGQGRTMKRILEMK